MSKGGGTQTQTNETGLDPQSQLFVDQLRQQGQRGAATALGQEGSFIAGQDPRSIQDQIAPFMNPFIQQVIGGLGGQFDELRGQARVGANQSATQQGAFGGSRQGVETGVRLGQLDAAQGRQVGGLLSSGFQNALSTGLQQSELQRQIRQQQLQEPLFRAQQAQQFLQGGLGPTGQTSTQTTQLPGSSTLGTLGGLALTAGGALIGGPAGASVGNSIGNGLFGGAGNGVGQIGGANTSGLPGLGAAPNSPFGFRSTPGFRFGG